MDRCVFAFLLALALVASACAGGEGSGTSAPEPTSFTSTQCEESFQEAAAVSDDQDTNEDLFAAAVHCTLDEAEEMSAKYPAALDGVAPSTYFSNLCMFYADVSVNDATLTALVSGASGTIGQSKLCAAMTLPTTTTSSSTTTTTVALELTPAQEIYCEDLITDVKVPTATGGSRNRPETVVFFELAERLGYLELPYLGEGWGQGVADDADQFVANVMIFEGDLFSDDNRDAIVAEWQRNLELAGITVPFEQIFAETCLQAWELR